MVSTAYSSWLFIAILDFLASGPKTRHSIKQALRNNDERVQLKENPFLEDHHNISTKVNARLYKLTAVGLITQTDKTPKAEDIFELTEQGKEQQKYYQSNRHLIAPPRPYSTAKRTPKTTVKRTARNSGIERQFSDEAKELHKETMEIITVPIDILEAIDKAEELVITVLANIPQAALDAHATQKTRLGRVVAKNNKLIASVKLVAIAMEKVERPSQEAPETEQPETEHPKQTEAFAPIEESDNANREESDNAK